MGTHIVRPQIIAFFCVVVFAFAAALTPSPASAKDPFAPPSGISATSASLQDVLAKARRADGSDAPYKTRVVEGQVDAWGLKGSIRSVESGDDYKFTVDLGVISWQNGRSNGQMWRRNENGLVILLHNVQGEQDVDWEALSARFVEHPGPNVKLLGETGAAYVVEAYPTAGQPMWFFYDKKTFLMTRIEIPYVEERDVYTFSDFHKTGHYTDPEHVVVSDGITRNDLVFQISTRYETAVATADTAMPLSNDKLVQFPTGVNVVSLPSTFANKEGRSVYIPDQNYHDITANGDMSSPGYVAHIAGDPHLLIRATIDARGFDFMLDSGAPGIFVSSDAVDKLGLKSFGPEQQTSTGAWVRSYALIPQIGIGAITLTNVIAYVLPLWHYQPRPGTDAIGLIGYDFIANAVLAVDFDKGTVTATNPYLFVPPADAIAVPATLDYGVPQISVQIGQSTADHFVVDTGSSISMILPRFADAHPDDVKDQGKGADVTRARLGAVDWLSGSYISSYDELGGGETQLRATEVKTLTVSGINLEDWLMFTLVAPSGAAAQIGRDLDGLLGYSFLKYFTVYLDYPQNELFLVPNASFKNGAGR